VDVAIRVGAGAEDKFQRFGAVVNDLYPIGDPIGKAAPAQHIQGKFHVAGLSSTSRISTKSFTVPAPW